MWRSRSGRQVRTATVVWRAVARQSMERVSSPGTYSRRLSNSVPSPRVRTLVRPSSSRRRASLEGRCLRLVKGGRTRTVQGTWWLPWREKRPRGPYERMVTRSAWRSPRRVGRRRVVRRRRSPAGTVRRWREAATSVPGSQLLGGQASRRRARRRRPEGLVTVSVTSAVSPRRTEVSPERARPRRRTGAARAASQAQARARGAFTARMPVQLGSQMPTGSVPRAASRAARPVSAISGGRGRGRGSR